MTLKAVSFKNIVKKGASNVINMRSPALEHRTKNPMVSLQTSNRKLITRKSWKNNQLYSSRINQVDPNPKSKLPLIQQLRQKRWAACAQCALLRPWSNPKFDNCVASKANDGKKSVFTEKCPKYSLVFML